MSDARIRDLERRVAQGDPSAQIALVAELTRAGRHEDARFALQRLLARPTRELVAMGVVVKLDSSISGNVHGVLGRMRSNWSCDGLSDGSRWWGCGRPDEAREIPGVLVASDGTWPHSYLVTLEPGADPAFAGRLRELAEQYPPMQAVLYELRDGTSFHPACYDQVMCGRPLGDLPIQKQWLKWKRGKQCALCGSKTAKIRLR